MESNKILSLLQDTEGVLDGHFLLTSGRHSNIYFEKFRILEHPIALDSVCKEMAKIVEDKNIELGASAAPSDATADGGGITLKATTDKTIAYSNTTGVWESNIGLAVKGSSTPAGLFSGISKYGSQQLAMEC